MKRNLFLLFFFSLLAGAALAQTYQTEFVYDQAGNRISRKVIVLPSQAAPSHAPAEAPSALEEEMSDCRVVIAPNPTKGELTLTLKDGGETEVYKVYVYDISGGLLFSSNVQNEGSLRIDLSPYPAGMYILLVKSSREEKQYKIIKQ